MGAAKVSCLKLQSTVSASQCHWEIFVGSYYVTKPCLAVNDAVPNSRKEGAGQLPPQSYGVRNGKALAAPKRPKVMTSCL